MKFQKIVACIICGVISVGCFFHHDTAMADMTHPDYRAEFSGTSQTATVSGVASPGYRIPITPK